MRRSHVLITGGAGFIGGHTADRLLSLGHRVRIIDNFCAPVHSNGKPDYLPPGAEVVRGDTRDPKAMLSALDGVDAVFHLAAYQDYMPDFSTYIDVNATSTALLYELVVAEKLPVRKIIVASSQAVLGEGLYETIDGRTVQPSIRLEEQLSQGQWEHLDDSGQPMRSIPTTETAVAPRNQYAISKNTQELLALHLGQRYQIPSVAMRYSIVQGPRQSLHNAYSGAMRIFSLHLHVGMRPTVYEDGEQLRDYVNIDDVVDANLLVLEDSRADYQALNVGGGVGVSVLGFYEALQKAVGAFQEPYVGNTYRYGDTRHIVSNTQRIRALGWKPRRVIEESASRYWEYLKQQAAANEATLAAQIKRMRDLGIARNVRSQAAPQSDAFGLPQAAEASD